MIIRRSADRYGPGPTYNAFRATRTFIEGLEIEALIGIYDWGAADPPAARLRHRDGVRQPQSPPPATTSPTLNYKAVSKRLIEYVSSSSFGLVETLVELLREIILAEFGWSHVRPLKLPNKPGAVRGARSA